MFAGAYRFIESQVMNKPSLLAIAEVIDKSSAHLLQSESIH
jgi:hypothetical protein